MLSTQYRLRLEFICGRIANSEEVKLEDMIWADKLAKANGSAAAMLRQARRAAHAGDVAKNSLDEFLNQMDLGDPDPQSHVNGFNSTDDLAQWFHADKPDDWRQRD